MKALFIGGTGVISTAVGALALARGWELTLLNRGTNAARGGPAGGRGWGGNQKQKGRGGRQRGD